MKKRNTLIYLISNIINKSIPFLLLPVLTKYLSTEEYGYYSLFILFVTLFTPFIGMNMPINISSNYFKKSKDELAKIISNMTIALIFNSLAVFVLLFIYFIFFDNLFGIAKYLIYLIPLIAFMSVLNLCSLNLLMNEKKPVIYGIYQVLNTLLNLTASIILIVGFSLNWEGRVYGIIIASIVFGIAALLQLYLSGYFKIDINKETLIKIYKLSLPFIPHSLGFIIINLSDRLFLDVLISTSAVGIYAIAYAFGRVVEMVIDAFDNTWSPWFFKQMTNITNNKKYEIVKYTYIYFISLIGLSIITTFISYFLIDIMTTADYHSAKAYVFWVALAFAFNGMFKMMFPYLVHMEKTKFLALITSIAALLNLIFNFYLIKMFGIVGAAYATLLSFLIRFIGTWIYVGKIYPMPWDLKRVYNE